MRSSVVAKNCLTLALFLMLATAQTAPQQEYYYAVTGKVIDEYGQPVAGAYIVVDAGPGGDIVLSTEADSQGKFRFEERASLQKEERTIYVTSPRFPMVCDPVRPPFDMLPQPSNEKYSGQKISTKKNAEIDVGEVRVQVYYGLIEFVLHSGKGVPLTRAEKKKWRRAWLRLRNEHGDLIIDGRFPLDSPDLKVALPEGTWRLEISPDYDKDRWFAPDNPVVVKRSSQQQVVLRLAKAH